MKSRREGRNTSHRERFVRIRESILYPFLVVDFDHPVKDEISVLEKLQNKSKYFLLHGGYRAVTYIVRYPCKLSLNDMTSSLSQGSTYLFGILGRI